MSHRAYRPPRRHLTAVVAVLAGLLFTGLVFLSIPLSQKIADAFEDDAPVVVLPPPPKPPPPPDVQQEEAPPPPEPEDLAEPEVAEAPDLSPMDGLDLAPGIGGIKIDMGSLLDDMRPDDALGDGSLDRRAEPSSQVRPIIPQALKAKYVNGTVTLLVEIDEDGRVTDVRVKSSTEPQLNPYAIAAVRKWKFKPAIKGGKKAKDTLSIPIRLGATRKN